MEQLKCIIRLMRINQWTKNVLIFLPLFFGIKITEFPLLVNAIIAFLGFSLVASAIYTFNDVHDQKADRLHPYKKNRPLAKGDIKEKTAWILAFTLLVAGFALFSFCLKNRQAIGLLSVYVLLNIFYTLKLKHIALIDISIVSIGFLIRIAIGGIITATILSQWIILMTFLLAFFLALSKRREDVLVYYSTNKKTRKNIDGYNLEFLNATMIITAAVIIVSYILYTMSGSNDTGSAKIKYLYLTTVFVLLGIIRYLQLIMVKKETGGPTKILYKDIFLLLLILGWVISFAILLY